MSYRIALFVFDGVQILDVAGPAAVFAAANDACAQHFYRLDVVSVDGSPARSTAGIEVPARSLRSVRAREVDMFMVAGGDEARLRALSGAPALRRWVGRLRPQSARIASVCTGAFLLAELGLLDGRRATTHWSACSELAAAFPEVQVEREALFVEDGLVWTSAGVTTGIDMSLALVERDLGAQVAHRIAQRLVLYGRRPGHQSQFSPLLDAQERAGAPFARLVDWMQARLHEPLDVPQLAARAAMSERSFHRKFTAAMGETPARFVETLRLERARALLETRQPLKNIAQHAGFASPLHLSRAFLRRFGVTPRVYRQTAKQSSG